MPKGDKNAERINNETPIERGRRMRGLTISQEDILKASLPAPTDEQIHNMLNVGGRPRCFESPESMAIEIEGYFQSLTAPLYDESGAQIGVRWIGKPTVGGLAVYLGVERTTVNNYAKSDRFSLLLKRAKDIIHSFNEQMLADGRNCIGAINTLVNLREGWVSDQRNIQIEPILPDNKAKSTLEIADFLDSKALPESEIKNLTDEN